MGACNSYFMHDLSPSGMSLSAIKKEKKLLLLGLSSNFELEFIHSLQSILCMNVHNGSYIDHRYNFGALSIKESTPNDLHWNTMKCVNDETYSKLLKFWKVIDYNILLQGWFRENCNISPFPNDIIKFMKTFCCIPAVNVYSYKMRCINNRKHILNFINISTIYRKCWSLTNNKECFRHKELSYCFSKSTATLFLIDLSCYNEIDEKTGGNKMNRTIKLYQWFLKDYSLYLKKHKLKYGNVLVIFDKIEGFKNKLINNNIRLSQCASFEKYNGPNDYDQCKDYVIYRFNALNLYSNIKANLYFNHENDINNNYLKKISEL